jgi:cytochrome P450
MNKPSSEAARCPHVAASYAAPYPEASQQRLGLRRLFFAARRSWLDGLSAKSYRMHMGEVRLPTQHIYMVNQPDLVDRIFKTQVNDFPKSEWLAEALRPVLGDSIFTTNGELWQSQRDMMTPALAHARVSRAFVHMRDAGQAMLARLRPQAGRVIDIEQEMTHVTADIIFRTIFSQSIDGAAAPALIAAFARYQELASKITLPRIYGMKWLVMPWHVWQSRHCAQVIRRHLHQMIEPRWRAAQGGCDDDVSQDILSALISARHPSTQQPFTLSELVDQVAMLFLAGHETSAAALAWTCELLSKSPQHQTQAAQQIDAEWAARVPELQDIKSLGLVRNIFKESMRLFPPVGFIARTAAQPCPMRDKTVQAGSQVVVSPWLLHRHELYWQRPAHFEPQRFEADDQADAIKQCYMPFGMGPRVCLGAAFAMQEAELILGMLLREFTLQPDAGRPAPMPVGRLTIRSDHGIWLKLLAR